MDITVRVSGLKDLRKSLKGSKKRIQGFIESVALDFSGYIIGEYLNFYQSPLGDFGYPRNEGSRLAQSVQISSSSLISRVETNLKEAVFKEFGTGIYATVGPKVPITPKLAKVLAFPYWTLPPGFEGAHVEESSVPGAKGTVFAKSVKGQRPYPIWFTSQADQFIDRMVIQAVKELKL